LIIWGEVDFVRSPRPDATEFEIRFDSMCELVNESSGNPRLVQDVTEGVSGPKGAFNNA
jgi:hypothetical protein